MHPSGIITLLTDFGADGSYVGAMKGAILAVNRQATIIDISHGVAPQDVAEAAWLLRSAYASFPEGTVHVVVVDPGVGGERRAIAGRAGRWFFAGPDNGVLSWAIAELPDAHFVQLENDRYFRARVSNTFHGRDIFAPVAAHLAGGVPLAELGRSIDDIAVLPYPAPVVEGDTLRTTIVHVDRFGNLVTSLDDETYAAWLAGASREPTIEVAGVAVAGVAVAGVVRTYSDAPAGALVALFGSTGHLEIAARDGSAAAALGAGRGDEVLLRR